MIFKESPYLIASGDRAFARPSGVMVERLPTGFGTELPRAPLRSFDERINLEQGSISSFVSYIPTPEGMVAINVEAIQVATDAEAWLPAPDLFAPQYVLDPTTGEQITQAELYLRSAESARPAAEEETTTATPVASTVEDLPPILPTPPPAEEAAPTGCETWLEAYIDPASGYTYMILVHNNDQGGYDVIG